MKKAKQIALLVLIISAIGLSSCYVPRLARMKRANYKIALSKSKFKAPEEKVFDCNSVYVRSENKNGKTVSEIYHFYPDGKVYTDCREISDTLNVNSLKDTCGIFGYMTAYRIHNNKIKIGHIERVDGKYFEKEFIIEKNSFRQIKPELKGKTEFFKL